MATATLTEQLAEEKTSARDAYRKLVADSFDKSPNLSKARDILAAAERSVSDFETDVATLRDRLQAAADATDAKRLDNEIPPATEAMQKSFEHYKAVEKECEDRLKKAREEWIESQRVRSHLESQRTRLRQDSFARLKSTYDLSIDREIKQLESSIVISENELGLYMHDITDADFHRQRESERHQMTYGDTVPVPDPPARTKNLFRMRDQLETTIKDARAKIETLEASKLDPANQRWVEHEEAPTEPLQMGMKTVKTGGCNFTREHGQ